MVRARAFLRALTVAGAAETVAHPRGLLLRSPGEPQAFVANQLLLDDPTGLDARELIALLDDAQDGLDHRRATILDEDHGARLHRSLLAHGWGGGAEVVMVLPDEAAVPPADLPAADDPQLRAIERRTNVELGLPPAVAEQLIEVRRRAADQIGSRAFVSDGVAHATLYGREHVFQIEDVATLADHRGRGHARRVVGACVADARARGAEVVFLTADEDDWPKDLYTRMGFVTVARVWVVQRETVV